MGIVVVCAVLLTYLQVEKQVFIFPGLFCDTPKMDKDKCLETKLRFFEGKNSFGRDVDHDFWKVSIVPIRITVAMLPFCRIKKPKQTHMRSLLGE